MFDRMHVAQTACVESCAQLEVRTPLDGAINVLAELPHEMMSACVIHMPARDWWYALHTYYSQKNILMQSTLNRTWKALQLWAAYDVLKLQWLAGPASRSKVLALTLSASMLWRMNALHSRPATGGSVHALHKATLPLYTIKRPFRRVGGWPKVGLKWGFELGLHYMDK